MKTIETLWIGITVFCFLSCVEYAPERIKDGKAYCDVEGNFTGQWYDYYRRALSCMEGGFYLEAEMDLDEAIRRRPMDSRRIRSYGDHYLSYFPNREKGILMLLMGNINEAELYLDKSIRNASSAKARFYLDKVHERILRLEGRRPSEPTITITAPEIAESRSALWTNADPVMISGVAKDPEQYISEIRINGHSAFIGATAPRVQFSESLELSEGIHELIIEAKNLLDGKTARTMTIHVDRQGPSISLTRVHPGKVIEGEVYDDSGQPSLFVDGKPYFFEAGKGFAFRLPLLSLQQYGVELRAVDMAGNETSMKISPAGFHMNVKTPLFAGLDQATDMHASGKKIVSSPEPGIFLTDLEDRTVCYKSDIILRGVVISKTPVRRLLVNENPVGIAWGNQIAFSQRVSLQEGENRIHIQIFGENLQNLSKILIVKYNLPEVQRYSRRYAVGIKPFDFEGYYFNKERFESGFAERLINQERFQVIMGDRAKESVLMGLIHETRTGVEIACYLANLTTSQVIVTADVYQESPNQLTPENFARMLSERLHRKVPMLETEVANIEGERMELPENKKAFFLNDWPFWICTRIGAENPILGNDSEIVGMARVDRMQSLVLGRTALRVQPFSKTDFADRMVSQ